MKKIFSFISVCFLCFSCLKTVSFDLLNQKKYVLFSIISPDQPSIKVDFYPITPLNQNAPGNSLENAQVKIIRLSDGQEHTLTYSVEPYTRGRYKVDVTGFVLPLESYKLQINYQGDQIEATTQVPAQENYELKYQKAIAEKKGIFVRYDLFFDLVMSPQRHYFYFNFFLEGKTQQGNKEQLGGGRTDDPNTNLYSNALNNSFKSEIEFTKKADRVLYVLETVVEAEYTFKLFEVNHDYFQYHNKMQFPSNTVEAAFSDPVSSYTNVQGGYGIFGAYVSYLQTLDHLQLPQILTDLNNF